MTTKGVEDGMGDEQVSNWNHKSRPVLVWADIDEGIADAVAYLNTIPGVRTFASCQGTIGEGGPEPYEAQVMIHAEGEALLEVEKHFRIGRRGDGWMYVHPHAAVPVATPAMKDEVESATTAKFYARCGYCERKWLALTDKEECPVCLDVPFEQKGRPYFDRVNGYHPAPPSPTLKDEVYAPIFAYSPTRQHKDSCPCVEFAVGDEICSMLCEHCTCKESQPAAVTEPSPQTKDEVYAMLNGLQKAGQLNTETVRILWPHLEDAVKWRKR